MKTILQQCYGDKSAVTDELVRSVFAMQQLKDLIVGVPLQARNRLPLFMAVQAPAAGQLEVEAMLLEEFVLCCSRWRRS